jgi:hypothetical protein
VANLTIIGIFRTRMRWELDAVELWDGQEYLGRIPGALLLEMVGNLLRREQVERRVLDVLVQTRPDGPGVTYLSLDDLDPSKALGSGTPGVLG